MSYETRAYDNEHGDPVVVLVVEGTHDVSRIVHLLSRGLIEHISLSEKVLRQVRRQNGGRAALQLLAAHGGPDFLHEDGPDQDTPPAVTAAIAWAVQEYERCIVAARGANSADGPSDQYAINNGRAEAYRHLCTVLADAAGIDGPDWDAIRKRVPADGVYR